MDIETIVRCSWRSVVPLLASSARLGTSFQSHNLSLSTRTSFSRTPFCRSMSGSNEVQKAQAAEDTGVPTIFDKIIAGEIPCKKVYEDDLALAFHDVNPQAPVHFLVIPKQRAGLTQISKAKANQKEVLGHLMYVASQEGHKLCPGGFRIVVNDGKDGAQSVYHLHLHVIGGRQMNWPPG